MPFSYNYRMTTEVEALSQRAVLMLQKIYEIDLENEFILIVFTLILCLLSDMNKHSIKVFM